MLGSITPGSVTPQSIRDAANARPGATDTTRTADASDAAPPKDTVSLSADMLEAFDSTSARTGLDLSIAAGRQVLSVLAEIGDLAGRAASPNAPPEARAVQDQSLRGLLTRITEIVDSAIGAGARTIGGDPIQLSDAGAQIDGLDLRLGAKGGAVSLSPSASILTQSDAEETAVAVRESFSRVSVGLARLEDVSAGFGVHANALAALEKSVSGAVRQSLDEDSARLLALQVRQTLAGTQSAVVNAAQGGILSHFRV